VGFDFVDDLHRSNFGGAETVPAGSPARRASTAESSGRSMPETFEVMCMT
jgi:hypothetical protein